VEGYIQAGIAEGARVVLGGGRPAALDRGWFVEPTVFVGVEPSMRIAQEEIFGPVLAILTYDDEDEAVAVANDSQYGLSGAVFTSDPEHGLDLARRMRTGTVELNGSPSEPPPRQAASRPAAWGEKSDPRGSTAVWSSAPSAFHPALPKCSTTGRLTDAGVLASDLSKTAASPAGAVVTAAEAPQRCCGAVRSCCVDRCGRQGTLSALDVPCQPDPEGRPGGVVPGHPGTVQV
jgi:hypothetical protein